MNTGTHDVDPELRRDLLEPFIAATSAALGEMAGIEVIARAVHRHSASPGVGDISVAVELTSGTSRLLVLRFPERTAAAIAGRVLAGAVQTLDQSLIRDCVGEVANVIAGQAKALLAGGRHRFDFSIPRVVAADQWRPPQGLDCLAIACGSELGDFEVQLLVTREDA